MSCTDEIHDWIGLEQPGVRLFDASWTSGPCSRRIGEFSIGNYPDFRNTTMGDNNSDGIWVPPNAKASLWANPNYNSNGVFWSKSCPAAGVNQEYERMDWNAGLHAFPTCHVNMASSMKIETLYPWEEHVIKCCKQDPGTSPSTCGQLWGDKTICDSVMRKYCSRNVGTMSEEDKKLCSCFIDNVPDDIDPEVARLLRSNPSCYSKNCNTFGYKPQSLISAGPCPSIKICKQDFAVMDGNNNLVTDNVILQDCGDGNKADNDVGDDNFNLPKWFNIKLILILLIVVLVVILLWDDNSDSSIDLLNG